MYSRENKMKAIRLMFENAADYTDRMTGELNTTLLSEYVCHLLMNNHNINVYDGDDVPEWLFDLAVDFSGEWDDIKHGYTWGL